MFRNTASSTLEHLRVSLYGPAFSLSLWPTDVFLLCLCLFRLNPVEQVSLQIAMAVWQGADSTEQSEESILTVLPMTKLPTMHVFVREKAYRHL